MNAEVDPWTIAMQAGNEDALIALIEQGQPVNGRRNDYYPPLLDAASMGMRRLTRLLLDRHADPNITDKAGRTPLHWVAIMDKAEQCTMLIEAGADPAASDGGAAPIHYAANNSPAALGVLLAAGVDPNLRAEDGQSALHWAARTGRSANVAALLTAGADPHYRDVFDKSALDVAKGQARTVLAQYLAEEARKDHEATTGQAAGGHKSARL